MKWVLVGLFAVSLPALAQWAKFTPCGLSDPLEGSYPIETPEGPAPNVGPYWVWAPLVVSVMGLRGPLKARVQCSLVTTVSGTRLVIGTPDEVLRKLGKK